MAHHGNRNRIRARLFKAQLNELLLEAESGLQPPTLFKILAEAALRFAPEKDQ